ncbi:MAG: glycosyltransferase family 1 protein [Prevotella sp.]|nr:glycosyltransferase family 1 protein [Prevotella sp.]
MKVLFLIYHGFSEVSGISKKIHYQVKGLRENGYEVHLCYYDFSSEGHRCRYINGKVIKDYGTGRMAAIRQRLDYDCIYKYCIDNGIQFVYARSFQNANPVLISFFRKLRKAGIRSVTEIPTYPYDGEFSGFPLLTRLGLLVDKMFRNSLSSNIDAIVTFSAAKRIFGQRTINISNGVDFDSIPIHAFTNTDDAIHLVGVAEVHYWHGYDRMVAGLGEYYKKNPDGKKVYFHIVGGIWSGNLVDSKNAPGIQTLIDKYDIADYVIMHGQLFGEKLDEVFNKSIFAVGSLGRHRSGITEIKTLKNREYATRGIPFIYSETDSDFDDKPYVVKAPADETPVDVERIIDFLDSFKMQPEEVRKTVEHLTWKIQMKKVVDDVMTR